MPEIFKYQHVSFNADRCRQKPLELFIKEQHATGLTPEQLKEAHAMMNKQKPDKIEKK